MLALCSAPALTASLPIYRQTLLHARAHDTEAYNLPDGASLATSTPDIADRAAGVSMFWPRIVMRVSPIPNTNAQALWAGIAGAGALAFISEDIQGAYLSQATINNTGIMVAEQAVAGPPGVMRLYTGEGNILFLLNMPNLPYPFTSFGDPMINTTAQIGYRARTNAGGQAWLTWFGGVQFVHVAENTLDSSSPVSLLFPPAINNSRQLAGKVRLGAPGQTGESQPDQIRVYNADGFYIPIAQDRDFDPGSYYTAFDNAVAVNNAIQVAFIATRFSPPGVRSVIRADAFNPVELVREGTNGIRQIEAVAPDINERGFVVFRAINADGRRAIWLADGASLAMVAREGDQMPIDAGHTAILASLAPGGPVFSGPPRINNRADVVFAASLVSTTEPPHSLGTGMFVARASLRADTNGDDLVNALDLNLVLAQYGQTGPALSADLNGDHTVDFADLNLVLSDFSQGL